MQRASWPSWAATISASDTAMSILSQRTNGYRLYLTHAAALVTDRDILIVELLFVDVQLHGRGLPLKLDYVHRGLPPSREDNFATEAPHKVLDVHTKSILVDRWGFQPRYL